MTGIAPTGLVEIFCDSRVVYRGFGIVEDGRFRALPLYESTDQEHDLTRPAHLDASHASLGPFDHGGRGAREIAPLVEVRP